MKSVVLAAAAIAVVTGAPAAGEVLNFDDLGGSSFFTSDYNGFRFGDNDARTNPWFHTTEASPIYKPHSGLGYIATDSGLYDSSNPYQATQPISRAAVFVFDGAYFSGENTVGYQLYLAGDLVHTSVPSLAFDGASTFVSSGYAGAVDSVVVLSRQGYYGLDDFTYRAVGSVAPAVPEPATWAMMLVGFGAVGFAIRRRRTKVSTNVAFG